MGITGTKGESMSKKQMGRLVGMMIVLACLTAVRFIIDYHGANLITFVEAVLYMVVTLCCMFFGGIAVVAS